MSARGEWFAAGTDDSMMRGGSRKPARVAVASRGVVKYFFLSDGWMVGRVWEFGGLWNEQSWRRRPELARLPLGIVENGERLWLYQVESAVLMVEVRPTQSDESTSISNVVLKRLFDAEQAIARLASAESIFTR